MNTFPSTPEEYEEYVSAMNEMADRADATVPPPSPEDLGRDCGDLDDEPEDDDEHDPFLSDAEADADALASIGWGTDEDYGYYGDE